MLMYHGHPSLPKTLYFSTEMTTSQEIPEKLDDTSPGIFVSFTALFLFLALNTLLGAQ